jgi:serine/threonine protein kinase
VPRFRSPTTASARRIEPARAGDTAVFDEAAFVRAGAMAMPPPVVQNPRMTRADAPLFATGQRIGRYEIVREIGFGGMAAVYAARLRSVGDLEKMFALKVLLPHLRGDRDFVAMFLDEARLAMRLDHPNIAQVYELGDDRDTPFLVMEYLRGQPLHALLRRGEERERPLADDLLLHTMAEVAEGLHAAHELEGPDRVPLDVVHRDVSPQNVHVGYDGRVRVVDFGIARARGRTSHTATGLIKGKFRYCSPEQVTRPTEVDRRTDIWALGVMLWEMHARAPLFAAEDQSATLWNVVNKTVPSLRSVAPQVSEDVERLVARCLDRDVEARPKTAAEVASILREAASPRANKDRLATEIRALFQREILQSDELARAPAPAPIEVSQIARKRGDDSLSNLITVEDALPKPRRVGAIVAVAIAGVLAVGSVAAWYVIDHAREPITTERPAAPAEPPRATGDTATVEAVPDPEPEPTTGEVVASHEEAPASSGTRARRHNRRANRAAAEPSSEMRSEMRVETLMPSPY